MKNNTLRNSFSIYLHFKLILTTARNDFHDFHFVHRGDEFRKDYSRISGLRSLLPQTVMVALTATKDQRNRTSKLLGMNTYETIIGCCDKTNIMYFTKQASSDIVDNFQWLIDELITKKEGTPKSIIYCRNIKSCSQIYALFRRKIGAKNSCIGHPSAQNCLYAMFHHSTPEKNKNIVAENVRIK